MAFRRANHYRDRRELEDSSYLMEGEEECIRLEAKTDPAVVREQALWAEIQPGMRVADLGCGCGKTTSILHSLVQPGGQTVGVDISEIRLEYAQAHYRIGGLEFVQGDIGQPFARLGRFDFVWVRFVLEYFRSNAYEVVQNAARVLRPGGILCLIDLDHNCLSHFGLSERLERAIVKCGKVLENEFNFDPYMGRKLYSYLYDLGYEEISAQISAHHLIYGTLGDVDAFNWAKKIEMVSRRASLAFDEYRGGREEFIEEFQHFFSDPRRFSYTPLVCVHGRKPAS